MSDSFSQSLANLELQPGQCQVFEVNGYRVEIHRRSDGEADFSEMAMLEPWIAFPQGEPAMHLAVRAERQDWRTTPRRPALRGFGRAILSLQTWHRQ